MIDYPSAAEERRILAQTTSAETAKVEATATGEDVMRARALVRELPAAENVIDYAARLVRDAAGRRRERSRASGGASVRQMGSGPARGSGAPARRQAPMRCSTGARRFRSKTSRAVALPVMRHRMLLNFQAEAEGIDQDEIVSRLLEAVPAR